MTTTMTFTTEEMDILRQAIACQTDINNDMMMDNLSVNIFPSRDQATVLDYNSAQILHEELDTAITKMNVLHLLLIKFGGSFNANGYSD